MALKDNVCVAGVPMMNGASTLEGYTPDVDATVVSRMLDAGATVVGKVRCEYFCFSGGSHTSAPGPVHNPRKYGYSAGGSSSGSAAVIVTGEADMAIGGDQGGSIRMPSAYCGIVGLKPTWGLVPYTGIMPIELTLDHTGPMTATVADNALMLEAIAGPDGLDPRQMGCTVDAYTKALGGSASGLKIGVVKEGFGHPQSEKVVDELVKKGAAKFKELGATVEEVSIPWHLTGMAVWSAIAVEGATWQMMLGNGYGFNWKGLYVTSLVDAHSAWRERADELSDTLKTTILFGKYALNKYRGHYYAKAQNLARKLTRRLRRGAGQVRPAADADPAPARHQAARSGRPAHGHHQPRLRDAAQHRAVRRHGTSGDHPALRHERGPAGRADADRQALERIDDLQGGRRLREEPRLEEGRGLAVFPPLACEGRCPRSGRFIVVSTKAPSTLLGVNSGPRGETFFQQ